MSTEQQPIVSVPQSIISDDTDPPEKPVLKDPPVEEDSKTNGDETETNISDDEVSAEGGEPTPVEEEVAKEETPKSSQPGPYVYDPNKITLKFIFANRDGVKVILECKPEDTVGEVKGALLSMWPESEFIICAHHNIMCSLVCVLLLQTNMISFILHHINNLH